MVARSSIFVLAALCLFSLAFAQECAYVSESDQVYDLRPLTGKGAENGDFSDTFNGATYYWNPCGVSSEDDSLKTNSLVKFDGTVTSFLGQLSDTTFVEAAVGDVAVSYTSSVGFVSTVHLVCSVGATPLLKYRSSTSSSLDLEFTYDCCADGQTFVGNKCRGANEANYCSMTAAVSCSGNGKCLGDGAFGQCSCFPGFSGPQCANSPISGYTPVVPSELEAKFDAYVVLNLASRAKVSVYVPALAPQEKGDTTSGYALDTSITFNSADKNCNYPYNPNWIITQELSADGVWFDVYTSAFSYQVLMGCGFNKLATPLIAGFDSYESSVSIVRNLVFPAGELGDQTAVRSSASKLQINFPKTLSVTSDVFVADNSLTTFTGIVYSNYDIPSATWTFVISATVTAPYMVRQEGDITIVGANGENVTTTRSLVFGAPTTCASPTGSCTQNFTVTAKGCAGLSFSAEVPIAVVCRPGSNPNCPPAATPFLKPKFSVLLGSTCPLAQNTKFGNVQMASFSDDALTQSNANFGTVGNAFFAVSFTSTVTISNIRVGQACARPASTASGFGACGTNPGDKMLDTTNVPVVLGSSAQFAFSVSGTQLATLFAPVTVTPQKLTVQVDLLITSTNGAKRAIVVDSAMTSTQITLSTNPESVPSDSGTGSIAIGVTKSSASTVAVGAMTFAVAALLL